MPNNSMWKGEGKGEGVKLPTNAQQLHVFHKKQPASVSTQLYRVYGVVSDKFLVKRAFKFTPHRVKTYHQYFAPKSQDFILQYPLKLRDILAMCVTVVKSVTLYLKTSESTNNLTSGQKEGGKV